ncbi:hypothetical protein QAD02_017189 [Eretmocerus hayati]|uniref:Uncharacterized protein n=1 Tax=Eretmocerus hayati TaxID=131215 RepID=A0ACC2PG27_9HYME|nr:hypothetical protein QAD02_017189 [Eretmocerus hayati]
MIRSCCVCDHENAAYKCPKCQQPYCSVVCCNKHKESCCSHPLDNKIVEERTPSDIGKCIITAYDFPTEDTVPVEKLKHLQDSEKVRNCLKNPQVRDIIKSVLNDKDPTRAIAQAMTESVFVDLADACLEIVEPPDDKKPC